MEKKRVFKNATELLLQKYGDQLSPSVKNSYFNGKPSDLGTHVSKVPGEVKSTNGAERRGGEIKKAHSTILKRFNHSKSESRNPLHMLAAVGRDIDLRMKASDRLETFAIVPSRDSHEEKAHEALRQLSDYKPIVNNASTSKKKQKIKNFDGSFLYSAIVVDGVERSIGNVLGSNTSTLSFTWWFPTLSRVLTSLAQEYKFRQTSIAGVPHHLQQIIPKENLLCARTMSQLLTSLPLDLRKCLKQRLAKNRAAHSNGPHSFEDAERYLMRMAQRNVDPNALDYVRKKKSNDSNKPPMKKARMDQSSIEAVTAAQLQLDKDDGEASDEDALVIDQLEKPGMEDEGINRRRRKEYPSSSLDIDGPDGILAAALEADSDSENIDDDNSDNDIEEEELCHRVRVKRELGDWVQTMYDHSTQKISCNCECFNRHDVCCHVIYVEVVHLNKLPTKSKANEQWQRRREQILHNLKTECEKLQ